MFQSCLHQLVLFLLLTIFSNTVSAPSPPRTSPDWVEKFLAMDWEQASKFSQELADQLHTHHEPIPPVPVTEDFSDAVNPTLPSQPTAAFDAPERNLAPASSYGIGTIAERQSGSWQQQSRDLNLPYNPNPVTFRAENPRRSGEMALPAPMLSSTPAHLSIAGEPLLSLPRQEADVQDTLPDVSVRHFTAARYTLATLPSVIRLPSSYVWLPSTLLIEEMTEFMATVRRDLPASMVLLHLDESSGTSALKSSEQFNFKNKAFAVELPSQLVLVKFFRKNRLVKNNPKATTMTIWTLELEDGQHVLGLRGVWGISSKVQYIFKTAPGLVGYIVRDRMFEDDTFGSFLLRQDSASASHSAPEALENSLAP